MSNILVTAVGSYSADIVIKTLKAHGHKVVGCDVYPKGWIADAYNVDVFYQVPYATEVDSYLKHIRRICDCHRIRYIIPLTDPEVDVLSREKKRLRQAIFVSALLIEKLFNCAETNTN